MRRNSPPRFGRRGSPMRRNRPRSLSPMSRNHLPYEKGKKSNFWTEPNNLHKSPRFRSRSRERRIQDRVDRGPPIAHTMEESHLRGRDHSRDVPKKAQGRSRERLRERDRDSNIDKRHHKRLEQSSAETNHGHGEFEESFMDRQRNNHFGGMGAHNEPILDPSSINFDSYVPVQEKLLEPPKPPRIEPYVRHNEKNESSEDRIIRLEKLVEKLVEGNSKSTNPDESFNLRLSKDIPELIPCNTKFTTSMWLNRIHEECIKRGFDEETSLQFIQDRMTGIMKAWFKSVSNYDFTWPELKLLITKTFPDNVDFATTLKLLVSRDKTSEETITQYYFSKVYLCEACKITGENAVSCLIDGLSNPFMKQDIKSYKFLTPEVLYSDYLVRFPDSEIPIRSEHREVIPTYNSEDFIPLENDNLPTSYVSVSVSNTRHERFGPRVSERSEKIKCFTCKKLGHSTLDCRHAPICYNCKKKGHIAAKCHFNNVLLLSPLGRMKHGLSKIACKVFGREYEGIVDTGSTAVIMKKEVASELNLKLKPSTLILKGYGGNMVHVIGEVDIVLTVDSTQRSVKAYVVQNKVQDYPLLVGQEFLGQEGVCVLMENGQLKIFDI